ncbi:MAG: hypothetical protein GX447_07480, partial [Elusimicrobia bacterium]|nr:hypothetical protein [Elusimicrobiota bacterium]
NEMLIGEYYYSKVRGDYSYVDNGPLFLDPGEDYKLWFEYNYPENSDKWPKDAKTSFESDVKTDKWDLVHKGDLLRSGNPVYLAMKYAEEIYDGKKVIALEKLKISEYKNGKWNEKLRLQGRGYIDGKAIDYPTLLIRSDKYYNVMFDIYRNGSLELRVGAPIPGGDCYIWYNGSKYEVPEVGESGL